VNKNYYLEYYQLERKHWWFVIRARIILERLKKNTSIPIKILNIGAATGRSSELLSQLGEVTSIEYDQECCVFTREQTGLEIIQASITELPFEDESFDMVCAFDVIEHVEDDQKGIAEMKRVCKKEGLICITVPAFMQLWSEHDVVNQHFRRYMMKQVHGLFQNEQLTPIYRSYFNSLLFVPIWSFRMLSKILPQKAIRKGSGSDFTIVKQKSLINKVLYSIFNIERYLLKIIRFPMGVSIFYIAKK